MQMLHYRTGPLSVNTYVVYDESTGRGFIIDPGGSYKRLSEDLSAKNITVEAVLLTHGHFDHTGAAKEFQDAGAKVYIHSADADMLHDGSNLGSTFGGKNPPFHADVLLHGDCTIVVAGIALQLIHTPGHTPGCICLLAGGKLFSGDTLFLLSVGRTDFPGGNTEDLRASLAKLFALDGDCEVYPGHDAFTTLDYERKNNPYSSGSSI